ncbi:ferritin-like domain-containing protein [Kitasatospora sp. NPDC002227]|uniref:ferritin-like domain-containing protein n=1 Tax=Kitasatospora sp. NPDC002227 TaxID=3154773 RepID=UPI00331F196D
MLSPNRRTFLALGVLTAALTASGCSGDSGGPGGKGKSDPDLPLRVRAVAATDALLAGYDAVQAGGAQAELLKTQREEVVAHRTALAAGLPTASPSVSVSASATSAVSSVAALAALERTTAEARLADLDAASPTLAKLLAAVAASDALHAAALGDNGAVNAPKSGTASPSASASASKTPGASGAGAALQSALAAEHAAVYGYGVIGGHLPAGAQREDGHASYAAHQARRDAWQRMLADSGATPTAAAAGYRLPTAVTSPATAADLAVHIEAQLTAVYADLVGAATGPLRQTAAEALRDSAFRARHWGGALPALPGIVT